MPAAPPAADTRKPATAPPAKRTSDKAAAPAPATTRAAAPPVANGQQRFDRMAVRAKLAVSEPGDAVEREADAIADKVTRMPDSEAAARPAVAPGGAAPGAIHRQQDDAATRTAAPAAPARAPPPPPVAPARPQPDTVKRQVDPTGASSEAAQSAADRPGTTQELIERLGPGEALDDDVRASFESRMGAYFGDVRIHTDDKAAQMAAQLDARAFAYGHHIAFAQGAYQPRSLGGRHLLAHELAHVMQQSSEGVARAVTRKKGGAAPKAAGPAITPAGPGVFEVKETALQLPPIKSRHHGAYQARADKNLLKREAGYDSATRGTKQADHWDEITCDIRKIPKDLRPDDASGWQLTLQLGSGTAKKTIKATSREDLEEKLKLPSWNRDRQGINFQIDHMVEVQLDGPDDIANLELLTQPQNGSIGPAFGHAIRRAVREEIARRPRDPALKGYVGPRDAAKRPSAKGVLDKMTVVFKKVDQRDRNSRRTEAGTSFWSREQIEQLDHVVPLLTRKSKAVGSNSRFLLFSPTGDLLIADLEHKAGRNSFDVPLARSHSMAGFFMEKVKLDTGYNAKTEGTPIGTIEGSLDLGPAVQRKGTGKRAAKSLKDTKTQDVSIGITQKESGAWAGSVGTAVVATHANEVEFTPLSPMTISNLAFGTGVQGDAVIHPTHPALAGIPIPATISKGRLGVFYTLDAGTLASRLQIPGLRIDAASVTIGYDGHAVSVAGGVEFSISKFGDGFLTATLEDGEFAFTGGFTADRRLFDEGHLELWYRKKGGFGGAGHLAINKPGRIRGIKSASVTARYDDSVFTAQGVVAPDIPGLKSVSLGVRYADDGLQIEGDLAIDDKVPYVESTNVHVSVVQSDDGWKVAASGFVVPRLPSLKGPRLDFSYDDGIVLLQGTFHIGHDDDTLEGDVTAGITNAPVGADGKPQLGGAKVAAREFHVYGGAKIKAKFHDGQIVGLLDLRLLAEGGLRVGGGFEVPRLSVFPREPEPPKDELFRHEVSTPKVGIPGMGFSVGSVSVGLTVSASAWASAHASIGPAEFVGLHVDVGEFDPDDIDFAALEISGGGDFQIHGSAGFALGGALHLGLSAAVVKVDASIGIEAGAEIPQERPIVDAKTAFTYSRARGLDIHSKLAFDLQPELTIALKGNVEVELDLLVHSFTLWSHDFTIGEANYKLPIGVKGGGEVGYNSRTHAFAPANPAEAVNVDRPSFDKDDFIAIVKGDPAPTRIKTLDDSGREMTAEELQDAQPVEGEGAGSESGDYYAGDPIMRKGRADAQPVAPPSVDEGIVSRLGPGEPLDLATRGFFEQRMQADFSRVLVHTGPGAASEARALDARAFTVGTHIAFAPHEHAPQTADGRELLAHELVHVAQQQGGTARQVARLTAGTKVGTATATPAAAGRGPITLPVLPLPELKYGATDDNKHRRAAYDAARLANVERPAGYGRDEMKSRQASQWRGKTPTDALVGALTQRGLDLDRVYVAVPRALTLQGAGDNVVVGKPAELVPALRQPRWNQDGTAQPRTFQIDHIVELQIGGKEYDRPDNLELLDAKANGSSGPRIASALHKALETYATSPAAAALPASDRNAATLGAQYRVRFGAFKADGSPTDGRRWTAKDVTDGLTIDALHFYDPGKLTGGTTGPGKAVRAWPHGVEPARFTGSPALLVLYASKRGGAAHPIPLVNGQPTNPADTLKGWLPGIDVTGLTLSLGASSKGPIGSVRGHLKHAQLGAGAKTDVDVAIERRTGFANAGVLNTDLLALKLTKQLLSGGVKSLSPVVVDEVDVLPGIGLFVAGHVQPTIAMLRGASLDFELRGDDLRASHTFSAGELALGGPIRIDGSTLHVALGTQSGLRIDGDVAFSIARLGQGSLHGSAAQSGLEIAGRFEVDRGLFDAHSHIDFTYGRAADAPDGKLSGHGDLTIGAGKVRGIRHAQVRAAFDGEQRSIDGTADLDIPGIENASMGVQFTPEGGTIISGSARFQNRAGIRNGHIEATLTEAAGGWSLAASGGADAAFAGFDAKLAASYRDGVFMFSADAPFAVGEHVSGRVHVGVTNGDVDDEGRLVDGSAPASGARALRAFGNGNVHLHPTDWLGGDIGLRVRPDGSLRLNGGIGIAEPRTAFEQFPSPDQATRTLFPMSPVSVPLLGLSVAGHTVGVALTVKGDVTGHAFVGPGQLTQTQLAVDDFDPADPASLRLTGGAAFHLPAVAGIDARLDAGLSLGAAVIDARAGIRVGAGASVHAGVAPHVDIAWSPAAGLHLHADLDATLSPRLAFDVDGFAEVNADALVHTFTLWHKDWKLAHKEIGGSLALHLNAPVDYFSDGRGVVFDPKAVSFDVPPLGMDTLHQLMNGDGGSERATASADA